MGRWVVVFSCELTLGMHWTWFRGAPIRSKTHMEKSRMGLATCARNKLLQPRGIQSSAQSHDNWRCVQDQAGDQSTRAGVQVECVTWCTWNIKCNSKLTVNRLTPKYVRYCYLWHIICGLRRSKLPILVPMYLYTTMAVIHGNVTKLCDVDAVDANVLFSSGVAKADNSAWGRTGWHWKQWRY